MKYCKNINFPLDPSTLLRMSGMRLVPLILSLSKYACGYMIFCSLSYAHAATTFELIIPSYNNERWCVGNLLSAVQQNYPDFHITYINDCSTDATGLLVDAFVAQHHLEEKITVIHNNERRGALENLYHAIHACADNTVVVTLDGDDMLANNDVLTHLANVYDNYEVWLTYGQFQEWPSGSLGFCTPMPADVVKRNAFREWEHLPSHLRTFYAWLFKKIPQEDLMYEGKFFAMTWDQAMMYPMMEMAGNRHAFIPEVLYLYNAINSISDHRIDQSLQAGLAKVIRAKYRYSRLERGQTQAQKTLYPVRERKDPRQTMTKQEKRAYYKVTKKRLKKFLEI